MLLRQLTVEGPETRARDLRLIVVVGNNVDGAREDAATLRLRFGVEPGKFRVMLVGKDGGVKLDERAPISIQKMSETIDAMPMRQDEMHR